MYGRLLVALALGLAFIGLTESTFIVGVTGLTAGTVAGIVALKAGAVALLGAGALLARRGKRELATCLPVNNPELYFTLAANSNVLDCARRYVCELEATPEAHLAEEEVMIRNVFSRGVTKEDGSARAFFEVAGSIGATEGVAGCKKAFPECPFDRKTIYRALQAASKTQ